MPSRKQSLTQCSFVQTRCLCVRMETSNFIMLNSMQMIYYLKNQIVWRITTSWISSTKVFQEKNAKLYLLCIWQIHILTFSIELGLILNAQVIYAAERKTDSQLIRHVELENGALTYAIYPQKQLNQCSISLETKLIQMFYSGLAIIPHIQFGITLQKKWFQALQTLRI